MLKDCADSLTKEKRIQCRWSRVPTAAGADVKFWWAIYSN